MTWLQNKEINYSTPSLSPSLYAQEFNRACTCARALSLSLSLTHTHTHTQIYAKRERNPHTQSTHTHTKQNKQGRRNLLTFLVCMWNVNSHIDKESASTETGWNNLKQSIKIWVRMELPETFIKLTFGAWINAWHDEQFKRGHHTTGHNGLSGKPVVWNFEHHIDCGVHLTLCAQWLRTVAWTHVMYGKQYNSLQEYKIPKTLNKEWPLEGIMTRSWEWMTENKQKRAGKCLQRSENLSQGDSSWWKHQWWWWWWWWWNDTNNHNKYIGCWTSQENILLLSYFWQH